MKNALLHDGLAYWARQTPEKVALTFEGADVLTYAQLETASRNAACFLSSKGVRPGDNIGIVGLNCLEWVVFAFAILKAGGTIVPLNERFMVNELEELIKQTEIDTVIADKPRAKLLQNVVTGSILEMEAAFDIPNAATDWKEPRQESDSLAQIIFTSGTTGRPKGVMISHGQLLSKYYEMSIMEDAFGSPDLSSLMTVSLQSGLGTTWGYLFTTTNGGSFHFLRKFRPEIALRLLAEQDITFLATFPLVLEQISHQPGFDDADLTTLKFAVTGGARVPENVLKVWRRKGIVLRQMYGLTEAGNFVTIASEEEVHEGRLTCGKQMIFTRIKIVDEDGRSCGVNEPGEIMVKGPGMMVGYWKDPQATNITMVDGWVRTGDIGLLDEDQRLQFVDRLKDMIITGGFNVSPSEVEAVVSQADGVLEVAVISVPDKKFGEVPAACIYSAEPISAQAIYEYCRGRLAGYKVPKYVIPFTEPLPRVTNGKIDKRMLTASHANVPERFSYLAHQAR